MSKTIMPTTAISGTTAIVSDWVELGDDREELGLHLVTTGTVAGAWAIEATCDPLKVDYADITTGFNATLTAPAGAATSQFVQCDKIKAAAVRARFTPTSGTGNARVHERH